MRTLAAITLLLLFAGILPAQSASGKITGVAADAAGLPVPGVAMEASHLETGETRRVSTHASGAQHPARPEA